MTASSLRGYQPRSEVMAAIQRADVLVAPSLRDSAGWAVAEAMTLGCPVVALDRGGPSYLLEGGGGTAVPVSRDVVRDLAVAVSRRPRSQPSDRWTSARLADLVDGWYRRAATPSRR